MTPQPETTVVMTPSRRNRLFLFWCWVFFSVAISFGAWIVKSHATNWPVPIVVFAVLWLLLTANIGNQILFKVELSHDTIRLQSLLRRPRTLQAAEVKEVRSIALNGRRAVRFVPTDPKKKSVPITVDMLTKDDARRIEGFASKAKRV